MAAFPSQPKEPNDGNEEDEREEHDGREEAEPDRGGDEGPGRNEEADDLPGDGRRDAGQAALEIARGQDPARDLVRIDFARPEEGQGRAIQEGRAGQVRIGHSTETPRAVTRPAERTMP